MKYIIEVNEQMNSILENNAAKRNISVPILIAEMLKRYVIDSHIMEQSEVWENGFNECADVNLDWANL
ncbi:MAG: hypothetical protein J1G01_04695 [Clostridiales bacterium]|nr:hypothetical protein [Clostridiales bacterium]